MEWVDRLRGYTVAIDTAQKHGGIAFRENFLGAEQFLSFLIDFAHLVPGQNEHTAYGVKHYQRVGSRNRQSDFRAAFMARHESDFRRCGAPKAAAGALAAG